MSDETGKRAGRLKLALVVVLFTAPLVLASLLYFALPAPSAPGERTNAGELLEPVRPLPGLALKDNDGQPLFEDQWTLLTVAPQGCGETCRSRLADTRQVRAMMHRRSPRVQRVLVSGNERDKRLIDNEHPDLLVRQGGRTLAEFFSQAGPEAVGPGVIYLMDPLGNWVLYYPAGRDAEAVFSDLKHLLKLSQIG